MDANPDFTAVTTADLEHSITSLTANINAATFEQLMLLAEFDTRLGWGHEGVRSCAHWLNWRCSVSMSAAREKLRVAHALQHLPQTRKAFASGALSYSKARAITRVGTVDNEVNLLSIARYGSASHLDRTVRLFRKQYMGENGEILEPLEAARQAAMKQHDNRQLDTRWDEHGGLEIRARFTAEQGAIVLKALEAAVQSLEDDETQEQHTPAEASVIDAAPSDLANRTDTDPINPPAGVSGYERGLERRRKKLNTRADALVLMAKQCLEGITSGGSTADRFQVVVHVDSQVLALEEPVKPSGGPDCYIENEVALPVEAARRVSCGCNRVIAETNGNEVLNIGRSTRAISTGIRRALAIRDGQCMFPGCDCSKYLDAHHIIHWANGGVTSLDNLMLVCHYHHVLLHEGGYSVERLVTGELVFYKPDGMILSNTPEPIVSDDVIPPSSAELWSWNGDRMDYDMATQSLASVTRIYGDDHSRPPI